MKPIFYCSDLHIGAIRSGGTTPATAMQLRLQLLDQFDQLLEAANGHDLIINGDTFDKENVPMSDLFECWRLLQAWLTRNPTCVLCIPPANHDLSKNSATSTSFDMLVKLLQAEFAGRVLSSKEGFAFRPAHYVVPHQANQSLFELELSRIPAGTKILYIHANVNNTFAAKSDHSLNISLDQAKAINVETIIVGHEHQRSTHLNGKVLVVGNQIPSSVADCLGNDIKYALRITDEGIEWLPTWESKGSFVEMDWRELAPTTCDFVRVTGKASAAEASAVVTSISGFRKVSQALVVTNAVEVESVNDGERIEVSLEQIRSFSVLEELLKILNEDERATVTKLLEKNEA